MRQASRPWFAGVDWASSKHDVSLTDDSGKVVGRRTFEHSGAGLAQMADWLLRETGAAAADIRVAIETPHGPAVETLLERGFKVYSINPKQLDRFRDRFTVAGAKDDRRDADVLGSSLRTDPKAFRALEPADPAIVELREWTRMADEHMRDLRRYMGRLREQLQRYFPAFLTLGGEDDASWKMALLELAPTPAEAASLPRAKLTRLIKAHRVRCHDAHAMRAILKAPAPKVSAATVAAARAHVLALLKAARLAAEQHKEAIAMLDKLTSALAEPEESLPESPGGQTVQRDAAILLSSPGLRQDHLRHAAHRGTASGARARLPRLALPCRRCPGDQAVGKAPKCHPALCLQSAPAQCALPLGPNGRSQGRPLPCQIRGPARPRQVLGMRPAHHCRPSPLRHVRYAQGRHAVRRK